MSTPNQPDSSTGHSSEPPRFCLSCGYNLTGAVSPKCSECGTYFVAKEWRDKIAEYRQLTFQVKGANEGARRGVILGAIAMVFVGVSAVRTGTGIGIALRGMSILGGIAALFLGLSVLRVGQIPQILRDYYKVYPDYPRAICAIALGAVTIALSIVLDW